MKIPFTILAAAVTTLMLSENAQANPPAPAKAPVSSATQANTNREAARPAPQIINTWDANEWDREGGASFWHSTTETPVSTKSNRSAQRGKATKGSRLVKKLFGKR